MATPGPRRNRYEIARDRALVAKLYLVDGLSQSEIGERLGVTQQQVSYDLEQVHRAWRQAAIADVDVERGKQLTKLDALERELWEAWQASKGEQTTTATRIVDLPGVRRTESSQKRYRRQGKAEYLQAYLQCIAERNKILGLYRAEKKGVTLELVLAALPFEFREEVRRALADDLSGAGD
jgi:DNA-binding transcriptional regulator LsrR (DeoR family)